MKPLPDSLEYCNACGGKAIAETDWVSDDSFLEAKLTKQVM